MSTRSSNGYEDGDGDRLINGHAVEETKILLKFDPLSSLICTHFFFITLGVRGNLYVPLLILCKSQVI